MAILIFFNRKNIFSILDSKKQKTMKNEKYWIEQNVLHSSNHFLTPCSCMSKELLITSFIVTYCTNCIFPDDV